MKCVVVYRLRRKFLTHSQRTCYTRDIIGNSLKKRLGTLAPLFSLRSFKNIPKDRGTFATGEAFLVWLQKTNQSLWQFLPLHTTELEPNASKHISSPYKGYGIGLDPKYLPEEFATIIPTSRQKEDFIIANREWIKDYGLFCALRDYFHTDDWRTWGENLRVRDPEVLSRWSSALALEIDHHIRVQWQLHEAFAKLQRKAQNLDVALSGDFPFYLSLHSPLVWTHQSAFDIHGDQALQIVSGVTDIPPSFFGRQVWGHPLYNWESKEHRSGILSLWKLRLRYMSKLFSYLRFDYAEAFYHYGAMSSVHPHEDHDRKGPGSIVFEELVRFAHELGLYVFAEDSGTQPAEMRTSLNSLKCPSIRIFRFTSGESIHVISELSVVYTTTHDTETLLSYTQSLSIERKKHISHVAGISYDQDDKALARKLRNAVIASPAQTVIVPIQDWLLTTERINTPGTETAMSDPNWRFEVKIPIEEFPMD